MASMFRSSKNSDGPGRLPSIRRAVGASRSRPTSLVEGQALQNGDNDNGSDSTASTESMPTSKMSKRRSLLPQFSRKGSKEVAEGVRTIQEAEAISSTALARKSSVREVTSKEESDKQAMPPPAKPASRPPSSRVPGARPTTSGKASFPPRPKTASRETNTISGTTGAAMKRSDSANQKTLETKTLGGSRLQQPSSRPTSSYHKPSPHGRANSASVASSTAADRRPATSHVRNSTAGKASTHGAAPPSPPRIAGARQRAKTHLAPPSRPTFSTYQQHYSPAKPSGTRLALAATKANAKPPVLDEKNLLPMTSEIALQQVELLQLSLMHQESVQALFEYEASAESLFRSKHAQLRHDYESIRHEEAEHRRMTNLAAIEAWCPDAALLTEYLQTLSRVVADLLFLTEPRSRFSSLTAAFDEWISGAESTLDSPEPGPFIQALPESSRTIHTSLALKLRSVQRDLQIFPPPVPDFEDEYSPSSLSIILTQSNALVDGMLKTLELMTKLQKDVQQREKILVDEQIGLLLDQVEHNESWTPVWQRVT